MRLGTCWQILKDKGARKGSGQTPSHLDGPVEVSFYQALTITTKEYGTLPKHRRQIFTGSNLDWLAKESPLKDSCK